VVAFFSVRKADEPADESHPYGHQKVENVASGIEGMLILVGAGIIIFESVRRLIDPPEVESLGVGIAVIAFSGVANLVVSTYLYRQGGRTEAPALRGGGAQRREARRADHASVAADDLVRRSGRCAASRSIAPRSSWANTAFASTG